MKVEIEKNKPIIEVLNELGIIISLASGEQFYYLPFWLEKDDGKLVKIPFHKMPEGLVDAIKTTREHGHGFDALTNEDISLIKNQNNK